MIEKVVEVGILFDFYGNLLTDKQYQAIEQYYINDLSLAEIGERIDISRQGVFDLIKRAEKKLYEYEDKLKLVHKFKKNNENIRNILIDLEDALDIISSRDLDEDLSLILLEAINKGKNLVDQ